MSQVHYSLVSFLHPSEKIGALKRMLTYSFESEWSGEANRPTLYDSCSGKKRCRFPRAANRPYLRFQLSEQRQKAYKAASVKDQYYPSKGKPALFSTSAIAVLPAARRLTVTDNCITSCTTPTATGCSISTNSVKASRCVSSTTCSRDHFKGLSSIKSIPTRYTRKLRARRVSTSRKTRRRAGSNRFKRMCYRTKYHQRRFQYFYEREVSYRCTTAALQRRLFRPKSRIPPFLRVHLVANDTCSHQAI